MVKRGRGDIFNMSSIAGKQAYPNGTAYCAANYGVTGLSAVMRTELKDNGVRVCCIHPGATWTPSWSASGLPGGENDASRRYCAGDHWTCTALGAVPWWKRSCYVRNWAIFSLHVARTEEVIVQSA